MAIDPSEMHGVRIRFQHQNKHDYCGPACAVMVLNAIHVTPPDQKTLFYEINATQTRDSGRGHDDWASSPDGLRNALNNRSDPGHHFTLYASLDNGDIARRLVNSLAIFKTPSIYMTESGGHWIVIYEYAKRGSVPTREDDFSLRDMLGFYSRDPFQEVPSQGFIDFSGWYTDQSTENTGLWENKFIAICDPEPRNNKKGKEMPSKTKKFPIEKLFTTPGVSNKQVSDKNDPSQNKDKPVKPDVKIPDTKNPDGSKDDGPKKSPSVSKSKDFKKSEPTIIRNGQTGLVQHLITESTAKVYTMWHLKNNGFYDPKKFSRMINSPQPDEPVLVQNLDTKDFFYITPILEITKQKTGMMRIDARDARFQEAVFAIDIKQPFTFAKLSDAEIRTLLESKYGKSKKTKQISVMPVLVWKQSMQSTTRFMPFYKVKMGSQTVYVRIDGKIWSRLTPL